MAILLLLHLAPTSYRAVREITSSILQPTFISIYRYKLSHLQSIFPSGVHNVQTPGESRGQHWLDLIATQEQWFPWWRDSILIYCMSYGFWKCLLLTTCMRAIMGYTSFAKLIGKAWNTWSVVLSIYCFVSFLCLSLSLYTILNNHTHTYTWITWYVQYIHTYY